MSRIVRARVVSRASYNARPEAKKDDLVRMLRILKNIIEEPGGLKDKMKEHETYQKPSETKRLRKKKERGKAYAKLRDKNLGII